MNKYQKGFDPRLTPRARARARLTNQYKLYALGIVFRKHRNNKTPSSRILAHWSFEVQRAAWNGKLPCTSNGSHVIVIFHSRHSIGYSFTLWYFPYTPCIIRYYWRTHAPKINFDRWWHYRVIVVRILHSCLMYRRDSWAAESKLLRVLSTIYSIIRYIVFPWNTKLSIVTRIKLK